MDMGAEIEPKNSKLLKLHQPFKPGIVDLGATGEIELLELGKSSEQIEVGVVGVRALENDIDHRLFGIIFVLHVSAAALLDHGHCFCRIGRRLLVGEQKVKPSRASHDQEETDADHDWNDQKSTRLNSSHT